MKGIFITGTDTNVGKTWVGTHIITALRSKKIDVIPRKPVESGWNSSNIEETDAWQLANAANKLEHFNEICPNRFIQAASPVRAAKSEGQALSIEQLTYQCYTKTNQSRGKDSFLYVEGAGGFYSPLAQDGLNKDLATSLNLPIVLVAENRLGCINQVLLSVEAINKAKLHLIAIVLNRIPDSPNLTNEEATNNLNDIKSYLETPIIPVDLNEQNKQPFNQLAELLLANY